MIPISLNPSLLKVQNILYKTNNALAKSLQRLSTGVRVNSASDDPAGYYVSQGLNSKIRSFKQIQNNITTGSSILNTAEEAINNISGLLNQLESLAFESANTTIDSSKRNDLQQQASTLVNRIKNINRNTTFNGLNVFGSVGNFSTAVTHVTPALARTVPLQAPAPTLAPAATPDTTGGATQTPSGATFSATSVAQNTGTASVSTSSPPPNGSNVLSERFSNL